MTVKKQSRSAGWASILCRLKLKSANQEVDFNSIPKTASNYNITIGFNEKDQLQIDTKEDIRNDESKFKETKTLSSECIKIDDILNCISIDDHAQLDNTLIFYINKDKKEALVIKFRTEQDFKRIYFTFKYFKMRNRLTNNDGGKKKNDTALGKIKKLSNESDNNEFDLKQTVDNNGVTHLSVHKKHEQPLSMIGVTNHDKSDQMKRSFAKSKMKSSDLLKPILVTNGVKLQDKGGKFPGTGVKDLKSNSLRVPTNNVWNTNKAHNGYDSDREEWRRSTSQFSTSAFNSLSRPTRIALTLRKIPKNYYFKPDPIPPIYPPSYLAYPRTFQTAPEFVRNLNPEHKKFASLQNLDFTKKKPIRFLGITNRIKEFGTKTKDVTTLKPVIKNLDNKRPVVRTCSVEPPKKVTFSAFATVQVV